MTTTNECVVCGRPTPDGYACLPCAVTEPQRLLAEIGDMAGPALDIAQRQTSGGSGGGGGKPGSTVPIDLGAMARYASVRTALTDWMHRIGELRGIEITRPPAQRPVSGPTCARPYSCDHGSCRAAREPLRRPDDVAIAAAWLTGHCEWMRHRPEVDKFVTTIRRSHSALAGAARRGGNQTALVGMCECGKILYTRPGRHTTTCPDCHLEWDVDEFRHTLRGHLDERHVTAAEAAHLAAYLDTDRTSVQIRKLVNKWAERGQLAAHAGREVLVKHRHRDACPTGCEQTLDRLDVYRFGDIADRLANTPRRAKPVTAG